MDRVQFQCPLDLTSSVADVRVPLSATVSTHKDLGLSKAVADAVKHKHASRIAYSCHVVVTVDKLVVCGRVGAAAACCNPPPLCE